MSRRSLMQTLFAEVDQTERSAIRHPRIEARRLVMALFRLAAIAEDDTQVIAWSDVWLKVRRPLIDHVAEQLGWFVKNPDRALQNAKFVTRAAS